MLNRILSIWTSSFLAISILYVCTAGLVFSAETEGTEQGKEPTFSQTLKMEQVGVTAYYPDGWSADSSANIYTLLKVPAEQRTKLDADSLSKTPQILVFKEYKKDHEEAMSRLKEIEAEVSSPSTFLSINGWPALQRRHLKVKPLAGRGSVEENYEMVIQITTAVAMDNLLIRLESYLQEDAPPELTNEVEAIGRSLQFKQAGDPQRIEQEIQNLRQTPRQDSSHFAPIQNNKTVAAVSVASSAESAGAPVQVTNLPGRDSELSVAASSDGQNIVVGSNNRFHFSTDAGQTWNQSAMISGNDPSLAWGQSGGANGTFYAANITGPSFTGISVSTDNGQNFNFRANAYACGQGGDPACGAAFPDQEHIAADRLNVAAGGDQVYSVWRHLTAAGWGIVCSVDSGNNWSTNGFFTSGDFPRVNVGQDGFTYVVYRSGQSIRLSKFNSCQTNQNPMVLVSDVQVVGGLTDVACPTPGLDRCNFRNTLSSPTIAVDNTDPNHVYVAYSVNTSPGGGGFPNCTNQSTCNESVVVQDSLDGGNTWNAGDPNRTVTISSGVVARRFMPWVCTAGEVAYVSWYDRRAAGTGGTVVSNNSLTDFYRGSASLNAAGNLTAGTEFQINSPGTADAQCEAGSATGTLGNWPSIVDQPGDSESCSIQPQLGGRCCEPAEIDGSNRCRNPTAASSLQRCDFTSTACPGVEQCAANRGSPKYGDYNGNACAAGRFYTAWASATSPPDVVPASTNIDAFFSSFVVSGPQIQIPGDVHFGDSCVGSTSVETLEVCNTGEGDLSIEPITSSSPEFLVTAPSSGYPVVIGADFCFPFQVMYSAASEGPVAGTLTVPSDDPVNPAVQVGVSGTGTVADIRVTGTTDFGTVSAWSAGERSVQVCNIGVCELSVNSASVNCPDFTIVGNPFPAGLSPGACSDLTTGFTPTVPGPHSCILTVSSDDPDSPVIDKTLTARTPPAFSIHTGVSNAKGLLENSNDDGLTLNLDYVHDVSANWAWDVRFGIATFDGKAANPDVDVWSVASNARYTFTPLNPVRLFVNGGLGLYQFDPGDLEAGANLGLGLRFTINPRFSLEATYNYHNAFTASPDLKYDQAQLGLLISF